MLLREHRQIYDFANWGRNHSGIHYSPSHLTVKVPRLSRLANSSHRKKHSINTDPEKRN